MKSEHTLQQVAEWMLEELKRQHKLHPDTVVFEIAEKFGSQFTYDNEDGNLAIRMNVLAAFRKLTKDSVVWVGEDHYWRMREPHDGPGRLGVSRHRSSFNRWLWFYLIMRAIWRGS